VGGRKSVAPGNDWMTGICDQGERVMLAILWIVLTYPFSFFRPRHDLALEVLALRHQLMVLKRQTGRPKLGRSDRYLWMLLMRVGPIGEPLCWSSSPKHSSAGSERDSGCSGDGSRGADSADLERTRNWSNSSAGCGPSTRLGAARAFATNWPNWDWKCRRQLSGSIVPSPGVSLLRVGGLFFRTMRAVWQRWISLSFPRRPFDCSTCWSSWPMNGARSFSLLDCTTDCQCIPVWHRAQVSVEGPRFDLRIGLCAAGRGHGHRAKVDRTKITLAKSLRRTVSRFHSARMPGSSDRIPWTATEADSRILLRVLPQSPSPPIDLVMTVPSRGRWNHRSRGRW